MHIENLSKKQIEAYQQSKARLNIFEGPVRAGKSFISLIRWIEFCRTGPKGPLVICGRTDKTIKRNIITPLQELVGSSVRYSIGKGEVHMFDRIMYVIGANDDRAEAKIRGSEFAGALIDELTLLPENFCKMLLSRLSIPGAALFASTNPDSPFHWVKTDIIDRQDQLNCKVFSFNIDDNPALDEQYKQELKKEYQGLWYKRYIEGKWVMAEGAVYDFFDEEMHVISYATSNAIYYIVGIDYGTTNPCVFTLIGYNPTSYPNMWLEKEYYYDSKKHSRQKSDYEYAKDLIEFIDGYNVEAIYVDPSAASFKQELRRNEVRNVRDAINDVVPGIRFQGQLLTNGTYKVCSNCIETIKEYTNYVWDGKASSRGEDRPIKQNDHCFDGETLVEAINGPVPIKDIQAGTMVLTPIGYKEVQHVFAHDDVAYEFDMFGNKIKCTETHKFYTANRGWIQIKDMLCSDIILVHNENSEWKRKPLFLTESSITGTYAPKMKTVENIIDRLLQTSSTDVSICIEKFGNFTMERFQKECLFITSTEIPSTMTLVTLSSSLPRNMQEFIGKCLLRNRSVIKESMQLVSEPLRKNGIKATQGENGTKSTPSLHSTGQKSNIPANAATSHTKPQLPSNQDFVRINVRQNGGEIITLTMSREHAQNVINRIQSIDTASQKHAQNLVEKSYTGNSIQSNQNTTSLSADFANKSLTNTMQQQENSALPRVLLNSGRKQKVYSLHVKDFHAYYANSTLTLNCKDAERYALYTHFFNKKESKMTEEDADILEKAYRWS